MPGAGQPLRLGPFVGGLNTASDPTAIADAEMTVATNFELDLDGSLISRPPFKEIAGAVSWSERIKLLCEGVFSGDRYLIGSNSNGVYHYFNGTWTQITSTFQAGAAVQYSGKIYLIPMPGSANPGGKWDPVLGFSAVAAIPQGQACVIHKERLFIAPGVTASTNDSRLKFSDPGDFDTWPASNFIDITPGDGSKLIDLTTYNDNLLLFKNNSTHSLSFDISPADAVNVEISPTIGVMKQFCMVNYENQVFVYHNGWVYEINNYDFERLNTKVPFVQDGTAPSAFAAEDQFISLLEDRLVCRALRRIYVFNLRTRTWTEWESAQNALHYFGPIVTIRTPNDHHYYAGSCLSSGKTVIELFDKRTASQSETYLDYIHSDTFSRVSSNGWGTADTGTVWTSPGGGSASEYSVDGSEGLISQTSVGVARFLTLPIAKKDVDVYIDVSTDALAVGAAQTVAVYARFTDVSNFYRAHISFNTDQSVTVAIVKSVSGVVTTITSATASGVTHAASTKYTIRFQAIGSNLKAKIWQTSNPEPETWVVTTVDTDITAATSIGCRVALNGGNTNPLPVVAKFDNLHEGTEDLSETITCTCRTKNFDMAIPHQFKRLWWWGADVTTMNNVKGIANPIVLSLNVTWGGLSSKTWGELQTWGQPLTENTSVETDVITGAGTARRYIKFLQGLRYRQINFEVELTTAGNTTDGPARIFGIMAITESRQVVSKQVS